jgi:hypothetical protein
MASVDSSVPPVKCTLRSGDGGLVGGEADFEDSRFEQRGWLSRKIFLWGARPRSQSQSETASTTHRLNRFIMYGVAGAI